MLRADPSPASGDEHNILPDGVAPSHEDKPHGRRKDPRETLDAAATIYDKEGRFLFPCVLRDLSRSGGRLELYNEATLPQYFLLSMLPDGSARRLGCKVWQIGLAAGVRFVERQQT